MWSYSVRNMPCKVNFDGRAKVNISKEKGPKKE